MKKGTKDGLKIAILLVVAAILALVALKLLPMSRPAF